jgi:hypothetical protein
MFPQNTVGTMVLQPLVWHSLPLLLYTASSHEKSTVQYDNFVWQKSVFSHVQDCDIYQFNPVSQCNCTRGITDRDADQAAGRSDRTIY